MKFFLLLLLPLACEGKPLLLVNATSSPLVFTVYGLDLAAVPAGTSLLLEWDFIGEGVVADNSTVTATLQAIDGGAPISSSAVNFTLTENQQTAQLVAVKVSGVVGLVYSAHDFHAARQRWGVAVVVQGFFAGLVLGIALFVWRLSYETFQEAV